MAKEIEKVANEIAAAEQRTIQKTAAFELANQEVVDAICLQAYDAALKEKDAKAEYSEVKDNAKRLFREKFGDYVKGVMYSPENGIKIEQTLRGGGAKVDQDVFLDLLYEHYGEEKYDKTGKAWAAFKRVSVEVECPRVIDESLFEKVFEEESRIASGLSDEQSEIPLSVFKGAVVDASPSVAASAKKMTKAEVARYNEAPSEFETVIGG